MDARSMPTSVPTSRGVNNLGYRGGTDRLVPGWMRWSVITSVGVRRAWQSRWLRRMLMFAWMPAIGFGIGFFLWEQAALHADWRFFLMRAMPPTPELQWIRDAVESNNLDASRHAVWAWLLQSLFRYPQAVLMVMVVGVISPPLISQDIRSRAFLLYFSRPLTRAEYLFGKLASIWAYLSVISTLPALALYLLGILLSPNLGVVAATWDLPLRIVGASVVLMLPTSMLALCFSSLTQESRYAGFAWFAVWILGWFTYIAATSAEAVNSGQQAYEVQQQAIREQQRMMQRRAIQQAVQEARRTGAPIPNFPLPKEEVSALPVAFKDSAWTHLSLYHTLGRVQRWVFGLSKFEDALVSLLILITVTAASLGITYRKISAPMRV
jgi:ABC-type transport system involved in multi-copper enzyme maturation permease subunit